MKSKKSKLTPYLYWDNEKKKLVVTYKPPEYNREQDNKKCDSNHILQK